jgi:hypothetical protein
MVLAVVLAIVLASLAFLAIMMVALVRHVKVLALSMKRLQEETQPILEDIQRASAKASQRQAELKNTGDRLRR